MPRPFGDYQNEIYLNGLAGVLPDYPMTFDGLEERASRALSPSVWSYVAAGAGDEATQRANAAAFGHWGLVPRMLVGAQERDLSVELWGRTWPVPVFLAPIGVLGLCAPSGRGDLETARAAAQTGVPMVASTLSVDPLEDVAKEISGGADGSSADSDGRGFFQLYTPRDRDLARSLISRAERSGYQGIVVTLDTWVTGWRPRDLATSNFPQLRGHCLANYLTDPRFQALTGAVEGSAADKNTQLSSGGTTPRTPRGVPDGEAKISDTQILAWAGTFGHPVTWDDLTWLREATKLPLILKGVCHPDDARRARDHGVDGIYCSNHGGRQANGGLAAIECLPAVAEAAGDLPVLFDSGIRSGADVVKALALGASAVGIGRPYVYGLALGGTAGAVHVLRSIIAEADLIMAVDGYPSIASLRAPGALRRI
ncbi:MAG TPA: alpha-hydroxy-acid oxidizing protein [Trebonia sp.]